MMVMLVVMMTTTMMMLKVLMMVMMMMMTMMVMIVKNHIDGHSDNHAAITKEHKSEATATTTVTAKTAIMAINKPHTQNNEDDDKHSEPHGIQ